MDKAVFLDRDGVINESHTERVKFVNEPWDLYLLPGAAYAICCYIREACLEMQMNVIKLRNQNAETLDITGFPALKL